LAICSRMAADVFPEVDAAGVALVSEKDGDFCEHDEAPTTSITKMRKRIVFDGFNSFMAPPPARPVSRHAPKSGTYWRGCPHNKQRYS